MLHQNAAAHLQQKTEAAFDYFIEFEFKMVKPEEKRVMANLEEFSLLSLSDIQNHSIWASHCFA